MDTVIPKNILKRTDLSATEKLIFGYLYSQVKIKKTKEIATALGSHKCTIPRNIKKLKSLGLIERVSSKDDNQHKHILGYKIK